VVKACRDGARIVVTTAESLAHPGRAGANLRLAIAVLERDVIERGETEASADDADQCAVPPGQSAPRQILWVVDEFHNGACDFRSAIVDLGSTRAKISAINGRSRDQGANSLLLMSATVPPSDADTLADNLGLRRDASYFELPLDRPGLRYAVRQFGLSAKAPDMAHAMAREAVVLSVLPGRGVGAPPGSRGRTIVFVSSKQHAKRVATLINADAMLCGTAGEAVVHHAKMSHTQHQQVLQAWTSGECRRDDGSRATVHFLVSTTALAEGFNPSCVDTVIVAHPLGSLARLVQAWGRGGRTRGSVTLCLVGWSIGSISPLAHFVTSGRDLHHFLEVMRFCATPACRRAGVLAGMGQAFGGNCSGCDQCVNTLPLLDALACGVEGHAPLDVTDATQGLLDLFKPGEPIALGSVTARNLKRWFQGPWIEKADREVVAEMTVTNAVLEGLLHLDVAVGRGEMGQRHWTLTLPGSAGVPDSPVASSILRGKRAVVLAQRAPDVPLCPACQLMPAGSQYDATPASPRSS